MSYDHHPASSSSLEIDLLRNETQNLKDEVKRERNKHAKTYAKMMTLLEKEKIPISLTEEDTPQQIQHNLEAKIKHYTKVQKVLALQVQATEESLAAVTENNGEDDNEQLQDLDTLLATLKQDLVDADEQLQALHQQHQI